MNIKLFFVLIIQLLIINYSEYASARGHGSSTGSVYVHAYTRSDGTPVQSHYRSSPDSNFDNNWSTRGNINPYTGMVGTLDQPTSSGIRDMANRNYFDSVRGNIYDSRNKKEHHSNGTPVQSYYRSHPNSIIQNTPNAINNQSISYDQKFKIDNINAMSTKKLSESPELLILEEKNPHVIGVQCEIKPVMADEDYYACGANPPNS